MSDHMFYRTPTGKVAKRVFRSKAEVLEIIDNKADGDSTANMSLTQALDAIDRFSEGAGVSGSIARGANAIKRASAAIAESLLPGGGLATETQAKIERALARKLKYDDWLANQDALQSEFEAQVLEEKLAEAQAKRQAQADADNIKTLVREAVAEALAGGRITKTQAKRALAADTVPQVAAAIETSVAANERATAKAEAKAEAKEEAKTVKEQKAEAELEKIKLQNEKLLQQLEAKHGKTTGEMMEGTFLKSIASGAGKKIAALGIGAVITWGTSMLLRRSQGTAAVGPSSTEVFNKVDGAMSRVPPILAESERIMNEAGNLLGKWNAAITAEFYKRQTGAASTHKATIGRAMNELAKRSAQGIATPRSAAELDATIARALAAWQAAVAK